MGKPGFFSKNDYLKAMFRRLARRNAVGVQNVNGTDIEAQSNNVRPLRFFILFSKNIGSSVLRGPSEILPKKAFQRTGEPIPANRVIFLL